MSIKVMSWVWENGPNDPTERLVLLALADFADDHGNCHPSMIGIGQKACVTERGARGIVRRLEADGWINVAIGGGRGGKSRYQILMQKPGTTNPETETRNVKNPERDDTKPGTSLHKTRNQRSAEPSRNHQEPSESVRDALRAVLSDQMADAFIAHRKAKRAKLTEHAAQLIAAKLAAHPDPDAVVEQSIMNGWTGVFPDRVTAVATFKPDFSKWGVPQ